MDLRAGQAAPGAPGGGAAGMMTGGSDINGHNAQNLQAPQQQQQQSQQPQQQQQQQSQDGAGSSQNGIATIQQIGSLLNRVTDLAQNAQSSFMHGQHEQSSTYLSDLQQSLIEIGELGAQSLALVHERQSFSGDLPLQRTPSHGHRRTMTESAVKKRSFANSLEDVDFSAFKTQKADEDPFRPEGHIPSAPPHLPMSAADMSNSMQVPTPAHGIEQPPSAPPYLASTSSAAAPARNPYAEALSLQTSFPPPPAAPTTQAMHQSPVVPQGSFTFNQPHMNTNSLEQSASSTPSTGAVSLSYSDSQGRSVATEYNSMSHQYSMPPSPQELPANMDKAFDQMVADVTPHVVEPRVRTRTSSRSLSGPVIPLDEDVAESGLLASERGMSGAVVPPELKANLDRIFFLFLEKVCSDVNFCDSKGEHLHQILTAKKMNRASIGSSTFRAFKFRIQAFTNAFHEEVERHLGDECVFKQTRAYLWTSNYIARFNESGVKEKSKGNHVWRVEARKNLDNRFEFREFKRKIIAPAQVAYHNLEWTWPLRIWDPQSPSTSIKAVFTCNNLPHWIKWKDGEASVLHGTPDASCPSTQITVEAHYVSRGQQQLVRLAATVDLQVMPLVEGPPHASDMTSHGMDGDQTFEDLQVEQAESVVADSQVAHVMSQIAFPFTPPASVANRQPFFFGGAGASMLKQDEDTMGADLNVRQPLPTAPLPQSRDTLQPFEQIQQNQIRDLLAKQEHIAATMQLNMPPVRRRSIAPPNAMQQGQASHQQQQQQAAQDQAHAQMQAQVQASMAQTPMQMAMSQAPLDQAAMQSLAASAGPLAASMAPSAFDASVLASAATPMAGVPVHSASVQQQQQQQQHPGLTLTPMSSLPQIASTLPQLTAASQNPMLSPALPIGFDPIASEGARIHAMQQQQQQHQQMEQERQRQRSQSQSQQQEQARQQQRQLQEQAQRQQQQQFQQQQPQQQQQSSAEQQYESQHQFMSPQQPTSATQASLSSQHDQIMAAHQQHFEQMQQQQQQHDQMMQQQQQGQQQH